MQGRARARYVWGNDVSHDQARNYQASHYVQREVVRKRLKQLVSKVQDKMENAADDIYLAIHCDCSEALDRGYLQHGELMPK